MSTPQLPALKGALTALVAAVLFGASTPLVQRFGVGLGPFTTALLLYAGAAAVGLLAVRGAAHEARVERADWPRLVAIAAAGAVVGPVALAWGLQRTSATSASLLLTLEVVFTALLARLVYREALDWRLRAALLLLLGGGVALLLDGAAGHGAQLPGMLAVLLATAAWGIDNTLSRALAERDPGQVVMLKAALGASASAVLAFAFGEVAPALPAALGLFVVGATGYGLSLRFYLLAQRAFGAARTGSVFAFAPFIGAAVAWGMGDRSGGLLMVGGGALMMVGIALHLSERHGHLHDHEPLQHAHAHRHDDGHHDHGHAPMPGGSHSHPHTHAPRRHSHPHVPDAHHAHDHAADDGHESRTHDPDDERNPVR